jgi:long-chain fatty acid transport protein
MGGHAARAAVLAVLACPTAGQASGFMVSEVGPKALGRGGAMVAAPDDPTALWLNPAGLSDVPGAQLFLDGSWVRLNATFTRSCRPSCAPEPYDRDYGSNRAVVGRHPGEGEGGFSGDVDDRSGLDLGQRGDSVGEARNLSPGRLIPFAAVTLNGGLLGVPGLGLGAGVFGPNTAGVRYAGDGPQRYSVVESTPTEMIVAAAVAYRLHRLLGLGAALWLESVEADWAFRFSMDQDGRETPRRDVLVHGVAREDFIPGLQVGFTSNPVGGLHLGGSFLPARPIKASGPLSVTPVDGPSLSGGEDALGVTFDDSRARVVGTVTAPPIARAGLRYQHARWFDAEVSLVREFWSVFTHGRTDARDVGVNVAVAVPGLNLSAPYMVWPKEYRDTWCLRAGGDLHVVPGVLTVRAGGYVEESAIPEETLDPIMYDANKVGVGYGFTLGYFGLSLTGAYQHVFLETRQVRRSRVVNAAPLAAYPVLGTPGQTRVALGTYQASFDILSVGLSLDVGEALLRLKGLLHGDKDWWRPAGPADRTLLDAGRWLQGQRND